MIVALGGGVGEARLLRGVVRVIPPRELVVIVNTGDDIEMFGLHVSPDIDIVIYTLAGIVDNAKGWGIEGDTFRCLEMLAKYGFETWFKLGDIDLATHIYRTELLEKGLSLSEVTRRMCDVLGVESRVIPMTDDFFFTEVVTPSGSMHFEEYYVKRKAQEEVLDVKFIGAESAKPAPGVMESIKSADGVIICPSNPVVSIGTILSVKGVREALASTRAPVIAVSPIVGGAPIKGPADKFLRWAGVEISAYGVAKLYSDFIDAMVIDRVDEHLYEEIKSLGVEVFATNTVMRSLEDSRVLAADVIRFMRNLRKVQGA